MLGAIHLDHGQPRRDAPQVTSLDEARLQGCNLLVTLEELLRHGRKEVNKGQVHLGIISPGCGRGIHC